MENQACTLWDRCKTFFPLLCFTLLPPIAILGTVGMVFQIIYQAVYFENSYFWVCGVAAFILMLFTFWAISSFVGKYCRSFWPLAEGVDISGGYLRTDYYFGMRNCVTGTRPIYTRTTKVDYGMVPFIAAFFHVIGIVVTAPLRFVVEAILIFVLPTRCQSWQAHIQAIKDEIKYDGFVHFFRGLIRCLLVWLALWLIFFPFVLGAKAKYVPENFSFEIAEKKTWGCDHTGTHVVFYGELINKGNAKVEGVGGTAYYMDRDGNMLYQRDVGFRMKTHGRTLEKIYLEKGESFDVEFEVLSDASDAGAREVYYTDMDDIQIVYEIKNAVYKGGKNISFREPYRIIAKDFG